MQKSPVKFQNLMSRREAGLLLAYLPIHALLLPFLIMEYTFSSGNTLSPIFSETLYFLVGFVLIFFFLRGFLRRSFDSFMENIPNCLGILILAMLIFFVLSQLEAIPVLMLGGDRIPLEDLGLSSISPLEARLFILLGFGVMPVVKETLFRGLVFGSLKSKNTVLAYIVSTAVYVLCGMWQTLFLNLPAGHITIIVLSYIPETVALAWCYDRSGNIWTPILLSAFMNAVTLIPFL